MTVGFIAIPIAIAILAIVIIVVKEGSGSKGGSSDRVPKEPDGGSNDDAGAYLICEAGKMEGRRYPLTNRLTIGHNPEMCNVCYFSSNSGKIAGIHCELRVCTDGTYELIDRGSANGTFLENGRQLLPNVPSKLGNGDRFYLANTDEMFRLEIVR